MKCTLPTFSHSRLIPIPTLLQCFKTKKLPLSIIFITRLDRSLTSLPSTPTATAQSLLCPAEAAVGSRLLMTLVTSLVLLTVLMVMLEGSGASQAQALDLQPPWHLKAAPADPPAGSVRALCQHHCLPPPPPLPCSQTLVTTTPLSLPLPSRLGMSPLGRVTALWKSQHLLASLWSKLFKLSPILPCPLCMRTRSWTAR